MEVSRFARLCCSVLSQAPSPTGHNAEVTNALRHISDEDFQNLPPHITDRVIEAFTYIPVTLLVIGSVHPCPHEQRVRAVQQGCEGYVAWQLFVLGSFAGCCGAFIGNRFLLSVYLLLLFLLFILQATKIQ